ncbi:MAG: hypothetical protein LBH85_01815 [Treponema sp.]|jgi:hypothetical protein|nr:hypothetical protein [Treponema sp.]
MGIDVNANTEFLKSQIKFYVETKSLKIVRMRSREYAVHVLRKSSAEMKQSARSDEALEKHRFFPFFLKKGLTITYKVCILLSKSKLGPKVKFRTIASVSMVKRSADKK